MRETLRHNLREQLLKQGVQENLFDVTVNVTSVTTVDPEVIMVNYHSVLPMSEYIAHAVKVEVSGRSMSEPLRNVAMSSLIDQHLKGLVVAEPEFIGHVVAPQRTFLEKMMLLHEELAKPLADVRTERMSRHLYDLYRMMQTPIAADALADSELYHAVMEHRRKFIGLKGFDYDTLKPSRLSLEIPADVLPLWKTDYESMCRTMIYGEKPTWIELMATMKDLQERVRKIR